MLTSLMLSLLTFSLDTIHLTGNCYNAADQANVKCTITVVYKTTIQKISADKSGNFAFEILDSVRHLTFESAGFETRTIGVNRIGSNHGNATFAVKVPMLKNGMDPAIKDDETIFQKSQLFIDVDAADSLDMHVLLLDESQRNIPENRPIVSSHKNRVLTMNYIVPGPYLLHIGLFDLVEKIRVTDISRERVVLNAGFNFLSVKYKGAERQYDITSLKAKTLYFDQSSYNLRKDSKSILDSICTVLVHSHKLIARVTGHTDNVGRATLNFALSEYRARMVQTYMNKHGVRPGQTRISWKGPNAPVATNDTEENKSKNRRVEIQLAQ